ncbi:MAG: geranylgeranylglycerol-phosphate geranylgeranyltransferase [Paludibacteraceae bacterium]|nr:geranylgeranylglycerol-phosphate geranylgeranyltransferase [Paludibacteraceae bacterium]
MNYLKLVRLPNLLFLGLVITALFWGVLNPMLAQLYCLSIPNAGVIFTLMLIAALFIAAAGYVINDYFDTKIDEINRPTKVIVGHGVTRHQASTYFSILMGIGVVAGISLSIYLRSIVLALIYVGMAGALWFYSSSYKRMLIVGNVMVAFCVFMAVFLTGYVSFIDLRKQYAEVLPYLLEINPNFANPFNNLMRWAAAFGVIAALLTWVREIVKDMQDIQGDAEMECHTMPIVWGIVPAKVFASVLMVASVVLTGYFCSLLPFEESNLPHQCFSYVFMPAMVACLCGLWVAKNMRDFRNLSFALKIVMLLGTLSTGVIFYLFSLINTNC